MRLKLLRNLKDTINLGISISASRHPCFESQLVDRNGRFEANQPYSSGDNATFGLHASKKQGNPRCDYS